MESIKIHNPIHSIYHNTASILTTKERNDHKFKEIQKQYNLKVIEEICNLLNSNSL